MSVRWYSVVVDCTDIFAQSRWWAQVLDWRIIYEDASEVVVVPPYVADRCSRDSPAVSHERGPGLIFVSVPDRKGRRTACTSISRRRRTIDQDAEVRRLEALGARRVDIGQDRDKVSWVVMADPEGNEFCVLSPRP